MTGLDIRPFEATGRARRREMNETCDRCGPAVRARYRAAGPGELYLCEQCAMRLWPVLAAQGWYLWLVGEAARVVRAQ
jgi:hypothetical protein